MAPRTGRFVADLKILSLALLGAAMLMVAGCSDDKSATDSGVDSTRFPELRGKRPDDAISTYKAHGFIGKASIQYTGGCNPANGSGKVYKQVPRVNSSVDSSADVSLYVGCFDIEIIESANGHISPVGVSNIKGYGSLVIKFTPRDGYKVSSIQIDGRVVPLTSSHSYRIAKIVSDHNVVVTFSIKSGGSDNDVSAEDEGTEDGGTEDEGAEDEGDNSDTTYTIAASVLAGQCTITPSGSVIVSEGASQSFSIAINSGGGGLLLVDDVPASTICEQNGCNYNFSNVAADHTISVICE
ncbi:MAG: PASTA domain-containing protein [Arenicellales bacterium]|nr:PASTA domain-containing protein [Arenicellales bacterium]